MSKFHWIYLISHKTTGKCYVGASNNPAMRWTDHKRRARKGINTDFLNAVREDGYQAFELFILENERYDTEKEAYTAEEEVISYLRSVGAELYNMTNGGAGVKGSNAEVRRRISEGIRKFNELYPEVAKERGLKSRGRHLSEEHRKKLSEVGTGRVASEETLAKLSAAKTLMWSDLEKRARHNKHLRGASRTKEDIQKMRDGWAKRRQRLEQESEKDDGNAEG